MTTATALQVGDRVQVAGGVVHEDGTVLAIESEGWMSPQYLVEQRHRDAPYIVVACQWWDVADLRRLCSRCDGRGYIDKYLKRYTCARCDGTRVEPA